MLAMDPTLLPQLFDETALDRLGVIADLASGVVFDELSSRPALAALGRADVLLTFWGCPPLTEPVLAAAPRLRAVIHAAGSVKSHVTEACWERGLAVSSAAAANSLPVAEYTVAMVLLANKQVWQVQAEYRAVRGPHDWRSRYTDVGNYRRTVGIVGASRIGRRVLELLRPYDLDVIVHDPYLSEAEAEYLGVRTMDLDTLCALSDVVSLHAPELPQTRGMISRGRLALLRDGATLINTARGSLVDTAALTGELASGRLHAVLDVTEPDVPAPDSPLYDLPNVVLTPHFAGSFGNELRRMADSALDEIERFAAGQPLAHAVDPHDRARTA